MANNRALEKNFDLAGYLKQYAPKAYGPNVAIGCPECDRAEKLWVLSVDKAGGARAGAYICYKCGATGSGPLSLVRFLEDCNFQEACGVLVQHADESRYDARPGGLRKLVETTLAGLDGDVVAEDLPPLESIDLPRSWQPIKTGKRCPTYLKARGIPVRRAERYGLGWCDGGYFRNRLIVPVYFQKKMPFYVARWMKKKPPKGVKKVIYPKGVKTSRVLFNYDVAKHFKRVVLVEDVWSAMAFGPRAMGTFGTRLHPAQLELLLQASAIEEIVVLWDFGALGKAFVLGERLSEFWTVRVVELPDKRDVDERRKSDILRLIQRTPVLSPIAALRGRVLDRLSRL